MSTSAEIYLISSILRDQDMKVALGAGVSAETFRACPDEWQWMENYYRKYRKTPTKIAFREAFPEFRIKAVNDTGHFAHEVRKAHAKSQLTAALRDAAEHVAAGDVDAALAVMQKKVVSISARMGDGLNDSDIIRSFQDTYEEAEKRVERVKAYGMSGIPTGFATLDERTGGPQPGQIWIVGARLGQGKSWAMMRMATAAIMQGYTVQYNALEQSRAEVSMRIHTFLSSEVGKQLFSNIDLMQGRNFDLREYRAFLRELKKQIPGRMHVSDTSRGRVSPMTIAAQIERKGLDYHVVQGGAMVVARMLSRRATELTRLMPEKQPPDLSRFLLSPMPGLPPSSRCWTPGNGCRGRGTWRAMRSVRCTISSGATAPRCCSSTPAPRPRSSSVTCGWPTTRPCPLPSTTARCRSKHAARPSRRCATARRAFAR